MQESQSAFPAGIYLAAAVIKLVRISFFVMEFLTFLCIINRAMAGRVYCLPEKTNNNRMAVAKVNYPVTGLV